MAIREVRPHIVTIDASFQLIRHNAIHALMIPTEYLDGFITLESQSKFNNIFFIAIFAKTLVSPTTFIYLFYFILFSFIFGLVPCVLKFMKRSSGIFRFARTLTDYPNRLHNQNSFLLGLEFSRFMVPRRKTSQGTFNNIQNTYSYRRARALAI